MSDPPNFLIRETTSLQAAAYSLCRPANGPLTWRLTHAAPGSLLASLAVIAALATITTSIGGLYWLGGAMAVATSAGLINSWVLLVEIKR